MGSSVEAKNWWRRPKRSWRALHALEKVGSVTALAGISALVVSLLVTLVWNMANVARLSAGKMMDPHAVTAPSRFSMIAFPACLAFVILGWLIGIYGFKLALDALQRSRFRLCPECCYDLSATPRVAQCPECARRFGPRGVVREWSRILPRRGRGFVSGDPAWIERHPERGA